MDAMICRDGVPVGKYTEKNCNNLLPHPSCSRQEHVAVKCCFNKIFLFLTRCAS